MKFHTIPKPYEHADNNCLYCAIGNTLSWHGYSGEEIDLIFNGQMDFYYARQTANPALPLTFSEDFPVNFVLDKYALGTRIRELMRPYEIGISWNESASSADSWDQICAGNSRDPVILFVDHFYLPYHDAYRKAHGAHFVTLLGNDGKNAYILDSIPSFKYEGVLTQDCLSEARVLDTEISRIDNAWMILEAKRRPGQLLESGVVKSVLNRAVFCMLDRKAEDHKFWGIAGIQAFIQDMNKLMAFGSYQEMLELDSRLERCFDNLFISLLRVAQQRKAFAAYLSCIAVSLPGLSGYGMEEISASYSRLHDMWIAVRNRFFLAHFRRDLSKLHDTARLFEEITEMEKETVLHVSRAAEKL